MATWADICTTALRRIGVLSAVETPSSEDLNVAFAIAKERVDYWQTERLTIYTVTRTTHTITSNDATYTIGASGDITSIARPLYIENVNFIDTSQDPDLEMPLSMLTDDAYAGIGLKALTSTYPTNWYWNPTWPNGTLTLWPVPTSATLQLAIYAATAVPQPSATSTTFTLPPGYQAFLTNDLAVALCPEFGAIAGPELLRAAMQTKAGIMRANHRIRDLHVDQAALVQNGGITYAQFLSGQF